MKKKRNELVNCGLFEEHCRIEMVTDFNCRGFDFFFVPDLNQKMQFSSQFLFAIFE